MDLTIRPATPVERLFAYEQNTQISERCGNPGYLWDTPAADPKSYDEQGRLVKPKPHDRDDAR